MSEPGETVRREDRTLTSLDSMEPRVEEISCHLADDLFQTAFNGTAMPSLRPAVLRAWAYAMGQELRHFKVSTRSGLLVDTVNESVIPDSAHMDWQSPPTYGGLFSVGSVGPASWHALLSEAKRRGAIADFHRFHPMGGLPSTLGLRTTLDRQTKFVNLMESDPIRFDMTSSAYGAAKQASRLGLRVTERPLKDSEFHPRYSEAMARLNSRPDLRFPNEYFEMVGELATARLFEVEELGSVVGSAIVLVGPTTAEYHLSEFSPRGLQRRASNLLLLRLCEILRSEGLSVLFLGGGRSSSPTDTLLRFKNSIARNSRPFEVLGTVLDQGFHALPTKSPNWFLHYR